MKLKFFIAGLLAAASFSAMAADQSVQIFVNPTTSDQNHFNGKFTTGDGILSGGLDTITLWGLAPGKYDIVISISGQKLTFYDKVEDGHLASNFNGVLGEYSTSGQSGKIKSFGVEATTQSPFILQLYGAALPGATYSGDITITAVPEPETYGMMLGGLGLVGFIARRRKAKKAA